jgi:peptidoglycan hydrolase-like protein with peptidoglycan-binding domain
MIQLGSFEATVTQAQRAAYLQQATAREPQQPMTVANMQQALTSIGFFPDGKIDGICEYRTRAAMRLFQQSVRSVEKLPESPGDHRPHSGALSGSMAAAGLLLVAHGSDDLLLVRELKVD